MKHGKYGKRTVSTGNLQHPQLSLPQCPLLYFSESFFSLCVQQLVGRAFISKLSGEGVGPIPTKVILHYFFKNSHMKK
jgi:hypothetical protein